VQRVLNPDDKEKICDLLVALCEALILATDPRRIVEDEAPAAFALAEDLGDSSRAARACIAALIASVMHNIFLADPQFVEWAKRADRHAKPDTVERAWADWALGAMKIGAW